MSTNYDTDGNSDFNTDAVWVDSRAGTAPWVVGLSKVDPFVSFVPTCFHRLRRGGIEWMYGTPRATRREAFDWLRTHMPSFEAEGLGVLHAGYVMADQLGSPDWAAVLVRAERDDDHSPARKRWNKWWDVALKYGGSNGTAFQGLVNVTFWFVVMPVVLVVVAAWEALRRLVSLKGLG